MFPVTWMDWHLSSGVALFAVTVVRLWTSKPWNYFVNFSLFRILHSIPLRLALLFTVFAAGVSGILIFQKSPLGRAGYLFGVYPMPTIVRLDHSFHNLVIAIHILFAVVIFALIILHVLAGLKLAPLGGRSRFMIMLWPWRNDPSLHN